ncbi:MAG: hypothetical protein GTO02_22305 [Candidatus Dadabacteria bacterium]|nr:hypothetical protein [Candidatus Dadabacteria bacterium]
MASTTARSLVNDGCITKINDNVYEVQSGSNCYSVSVLKGSIWCDAGSCMGFRFRQDCKHCKAVAIFDDLDVEPIVPTKSMREAISNNRTHVPNKPKKAKKKPKQKPDQVETIPESRWVRARDYQ